MAQKKHYSWLINPANGDYLIDKGNPIRDESLQFPVYVRLKVKKDSWMYASSSDYGSNYSTVKKRISITQSLLRSIGTRALQPIIDDGRALEIDFSVVTSNRNLEEQLCTVIDNDSNIVSFELSSVGL